MLCAVVIKQQMSGDRKYAILTGNEMNGIRRIVHHPLGRGQQLSQLSRIAARFDKVIPNGWLFP